MRKGAFTAKKEKRAEILRIVKNKEIVTLVKMYKPKNMKNKIKKQMFLARNIFLIFWVVGKLGR